VIRLSRTCRPLVLMFAQYIQTPGADGCFQFLPRYRTWRRPRGKVLVVGAGLELLAAVEGVQGMAGVG